MTQLYLSDNVYFCITEGQGVFLDLSQDAYSSVSLPPEPIDDVAGTNLARLTAAFAPHLQELLAEGLVTTKPSNEPGFFAYRSIARGHSNIFHPHDDRAFGETCAADHNVRLGLGDILDFFLSANRASALLKNQHICLTVGQVRERKAANDIAVDPVALRHQTAIFRKLRPWYARPYLCLWDALALIEFLARRRMFPTWVFGVQAQPFAAHCWVQQGGILLNEGTEYAQQFTPIMTV